MPWLKWRKKKKVLWPGDKEKKCSCARCQGDEPWPGEKE